MKPKNKYQQNIINLSKGIRTLTEKETKWAFKHCFHHYAYRLKNGHTTCMECGKDLDKVEQDTQIVICPHCGTQLEVKTTRNKKLSDKSYVSFMTTRKGFQVERVFMAEQQLLKGEKAIYGLIEISQRWMDLSGKITYIGLKRRMGKYIDTWDYYDGLELRGQSHWVYDRIANMSFNCPFEKVLPILKRNGYSNKFTFSDKLQLGKAILQHPQIETLMKANRYNIVDYFLQKGISYLKDYWNSLRICIKQKYNIEDISIWCDMVDILRYYHKDINSPKYICPINLKEEHDKWVAKRSRDREKEYAIEREQQRLLEEEKRREKKQDFYSLKNKFFGLNFSNENIQIVVLESIEDFKKEGEVLHHCVYTNEYYGKKDSLILSARIDNIPIETIELSLSTMQILQARGKYNENSPYHDDIISLVSNNIPLIQKRLMA